MIPWYTYYGLIVLGVAIGVFVMAVLTIVGERRDGQTGQIPPKRPPLRKEETNGEEW